MFDTTTLVMLLIAIGLGGYLVILRPERLPDALGQIRNQFTGLALRMPLAILAASFMSGLVPSDAIAPLIGAQSGWKGVILACFLGALLPGGPMISFPLALVIWDMGAGQVQMVALLTSWSVYAVHRILAYELPIMGGRFVLLRLASSWMLPPLSALLASLMLLVAG